MGKLSNDILLESFYKAVGLNLEEDFIQLLLAEIRSRKLQVRQDFMYKAQAFHS